MGLAAHAILAQGNRRLRHLRRDKFDRMSAMHAHLKPFSRPAASWPPGFFLLVVLKPRERTGTGSLGPLVFPTSP